MTMLEMQGLYGELFASRAMAEVFSDRATLQAMLDFEAALARAEARVGVIPTEAAPKIEACCRAELYDIAEIGRQATLAGNPAIPMVKMLTAEVAKHDPDAARWVHWGATSQDVIDTGRAIQLGHASGLLKQNAATLAIALYKLAKTHRTTPCIGRSFLQHATPTSFGLKVAYWLHPVIDLFDGLFTTAAERRQLGGAVGSLAALGEKAIAVQDAFNLEANGIDAYIIPWHANRYKLTLLAAKCAALTGHLGKISRDISLMCQTEIGELAEPDVPGKGGSSTMPHKRNPVLCTTILSAAIRAPGLAATMMSALPQEHERGLGGWHAEWLTLPELMRLTDAALTQTTSLIAGLQVYPERMLANIDVTNGLAMAERASFLLARTMGRSEAHHMIEAACRVTATTGQHLRDILGQNLEISAVIPKTELDACFDPATALGAADILIDRIFAEFDEEYESMVADPTQRPV